jgi:hypothetical protein
MAVSEHDLIRAFIRKLGLLSAGNLDTDKLDAQAEAYADVLEGKYDPRIWSRETLQDVSGRFRYLPSLSELEGVLRLWKSVWRVRDDPTITSRVQQAKAIAHGEKEKGAVNEEMAARIRATLTYRKGSDAD